MADTPPATPVIETATRVLTLVSLLIAVVAAWKALPADAQIKNLQARAQELDLALKKADADLKNLESDRRLTFELYQEVKNVLARKDAGAREEDAVRVLVESLAEDPLRWKLLNVLAVGASSSEVKQVASEGSKFYEDQAGIRQLTAAQVAALAPQAATGFAAYNVDVFYCAMRQTSAKPLAEAALTLRPGTMQTLWRLRALPDSINQQAGYSISDNQIRYNAPDETQAAQALREALAAKGIQATLHTVSTPTPGYLSLFICQ